MTFHHGRVAEKFHHAAEDLERIADKAEHATSAALTTLAARMTARNWTCELLLDGPLEDAVLRLQLNGPHSNSRQAIEVVVRDHGDGSYFAWSSTPYLPIAPIADIGLICEAIEQTVRRLRSPASATGTPEETTP